MAARTLDLDKLLRAGATIWGSLRVVLLLSKRMQKVACDSLFIQVLAYTATEQAPLYICYVAQELALRYVQVEQLMNEKMIKYLQHTLYSSLQRGSIHSSASSLILLRNRTPLVVILL